MTTEERRRTLNNRPPPFPEDFWERLEGLKELSGLSWGEFAERQKRDAARPVEVAQGRAAFRGAYLWAIIELAREVPGWLRPDHARRRRSAGIERR